MSASVLDGPTARRFTVWLLTNRCGISTAAKSVRYLRFLERERDLTLDPIAQEDALELLAEWRQRGVKPRTLNSWIRELNLWSRFRKLGWKLAYFRRGDSPQIRVPDEATVRRILALSWSDRGANARNRVLLRVLIQVGIRRNELTHLELHDLVDGETGPVLRVRHAKGEKQREVPISEDLAADLRAYIALFRSPSHRRALFTTGRGAITYNYVGKVVKEAGARIGAPWLSAHKLRHFTVDYALDHGVTVGSVAELMGHARWETTQLYRQRRLARRQMEREFRALPQLKPGKR